MTRDGLPRAYLRMDPNLDQHADPLTMLRLMCAAARQPERGRFKDLAIIERAIGKAKAKAAETRHDIVAVKGGYYLDGWDEWQEGDWTVAERMARMRARRRIARDVRVTPSPSPRRNDVTTDASTRDSTVGVVGVDSEIPPPPAKRGRRKAGTSPRQLGEHPRANGTNPRAEGRSPRQEKRGGMTSLAKILELANAQGRS